MMHDYSRKKIKDLNKGDIVISYDKYLNKMSSVIECVVKTKCNTNPYPMYNISKLNITPYHPIIYNGHWTFPIDVAKPVYINTEYIYSIVTDNRNSIVVDDYTFATLGHSMNGNVIGHGYFGTDLVINDLKKFNTYDNGFVELEPEMIHRDVEEDIVYMISID